MFQLQITSMDVIYVHEGPLSMLVEEKEGRHLY